VLIVRDFRLAEEMRWPGTSRVIDVKTLVSRTNFSTLNEIFFFSS